MSAEERIESIGEHVDIPDMNQTMARHFKGFCDFIDGSASVPVEDGDEKDILHFETSQVKDVIPEEEAGKFTIVFNEAIHGKRNKEIVVTTAAVSFVALTACIAGTTRRGQRIPRSYRFSKKQVTGQKS